MPLDTLLETSGAYAQAAQRRGRPLERLSTNAPPSRVGIFAGAKTGRFTTSIMLLLGIYAGCCAAFRQTNQDVDRSKTLVVFPGGAIGQVLYNVWRPLTYLDGALTGIEVEVRSQHPRRVVPR
jgi:hypothetical protein